MNSSIGRQISEFIPLITPETDKGPTASSGALSTKTPHVFSTGCWENDERDQRHTPRSEQYKLEAVPPHCNDSIRGALDKSKVVAASTTSTQQFHIAGNFMLPRPLESLGMIWASPIGVDRANTPASKTSGEIPAAAMGSA